ncbi:MAG: CinA family protein [Mariprofundaceae bacterium]
MTRAFLVISEAARVDLAGAGISAGWLAAWLRSAGAESVEVCALTEPGWREASGWQVCLGSEAELFRLGLAQGRRIAAMEGKQGLIGAERLRLINPERNAWWYRRSEKQDITLLLPLGDVAYQRQTWLSVLNGGQPLSPLNVFHEESGDLILEPGLAASTGDAPITDALLNDGGYLPEEQLLHLLKQRGWGVRFAESCTGGGLSERLSRIPGASTVLDQSWVTYSNAAKQSLLHVPRRLIEKHGAVSHEVVEAMAEAGRDREHACVAVSGIAGPDSDHQPVGRVWIATSLPTGATCSQCLQLDGSRASIRARAVIAAMVLVINGLRAD